MIGTTRGLGQVALDAAHDGDSSKELAVGDLTASRGRELSEQVVVASYRGKEAPAMKGMRK
jgi:hypothetical protein